jgi:poly(A) polymerase/tRNA nucleotidyltransferase (CCA-adding enzyme)
VREGPKSFERMNYKIPNQVLESLNRLEEAGFEAYLVGGCVRDLLLGRIPKDWDITTNANPNEIQKVFDNSFYENKFGTVGVITGSEEPSLRVIEVTPYRMEAKYTDKRHPDIVRFAGKLEDDLRRRDFTVNAMAMKISQLAYVRQKTGYKRREKGGGVVEEKFVEIVDLWGGRKDLEKKLIKTVGLPEERFGEDALRMLRAVRLAAELGFTVDKDTEEAIKAKGSLLRVISMERIRDEFSKSIMSDNAEKAVRELEKLGILKYIAPELEEGIEVWQNKGHVYPVWDHNLRSLAHASRKKYPLAVRLAALFHDVGKPRTKKGESPDCTFYSHELVGAKITARILSRLRYPRKLTEKVIKLVRWHLFFSDTGVITLSAVRRMIRNVGEENIWDLIKLRFCDRVGMGRPKEEPYRLRKYESMVEEALRTPYSVAMLKIDGNKVMELGGIKPGPKVGYILHALLEEVLDDASLNTKEYLEKRVMDLVKMSDEELERLGEKGKKSLRKEEEREIFGIRRKYGVR